MAEPDLEGGVTGNVRMSSVLLCFVGETVEPHVLLCPLHAYNE